MRYTFVGLVVLSVVFAITSGITEQGRRIKVENESNPGKDVLRLEVVEAVNYEIGSEKTLVICFRVMPASGAKQGVSGKLSIEYDGKPMRTDGAGPSRGVRLTPNAEDLFIARIDVGRTRGAGELEYLKASVSSVSFFDV